MTMTLALLLALQQHQHHDAHPQPEATQEVAVDHSQMDHSDHQDMDHDDVDHSQMDHSQMDHGDTDHAQMDHGEDPEVDHSTMDHSEMDHGEEQAVDHSTMDHSAMDHSQVDHGNEQAVDHSTMDHATMDHSAHQQSDIPVLPPPPEAGSGPARAADAIWGAEAMARSRADLKEDHGGQEVLWFQADRAEIRFADEGEAYLWDVQGYYGGDIDKFWVESEGEGDFGGELEDASIEGLWAHAIGPFWDLQTGIRQDLTGPKRTYATIGVQGLAPYLFEIDAAAYLSNEGDLTAEIEAELDQLITNRLILQPRAELVLAAQDVPELGIAAGVSKAEIGVRLRYEFAREFAPYVGIEQEWSFLGETEARTNFVAGVKFWF
ncbi:copper resistance protein B [Sphingomicrobium marinum]|uniref:copper resistance protein B n=1 Tax=Sphingomicrobium marinum TaxID=1227950 RepID=UPI002240216D|nr:copper resistance protein B [Sphingomicrobium marinum]